MPLKQSYLYNTDRLTIHIRTAFTDFWTVYRILSTSSALLGRPYGVTGGLIIKCSWRFSFFLSFRPPFSEFPLPIALKLCHMVAIWPNFIMQVQKLWGTPPKKSGGQKHAKFRSILDHFRIWSRISPEWLKISKIDRRYKLWQFLLRLMKKVRWTLVH